MVSKNWLNAVALAAACALPATAGALTVTPTECQEGSDFIRNAAHSRDQGMSAKDFLARLETDLAMLRFIPVQLRWFAQDEDDERLLRTAAERVFAFPRDPESHSLEFRAQCRVAILTAATEQSKVASRGHSSR